ncbi:prolyl oligopeptidase family serine peptidase [Streptomyces aureoversilis]|uniref:Prolyl oligopeptidase family serine peptidase n=1 Tax=Streptomyces aureoversilis TaxID=67277 RepID=A0ABW0ABG2_9ACTN
MADGVPAAGDAARPDGRTGEPADPFRWLEEDSSRTRAWLTAQQRLLEAHRERTDDHAWQSLLRRIETATAGRLLSPPVEAGGVLFRQVLSASGSELLTATDPHGRTRTLLDTGDRPSPTRTAGLHPDPHGRALLVQLHHDGHENGGLHLIPTDGTAPAAYLPDASPHPAVAYAGDLLLYSAGTRTEHALHARPLRDDPARSAARHPYRTVELPVPGPVRISLHRGPGGHLLLRTRAAKAPSAQWWCTLWDGHGTPDWQPLPLDDLRITAFALGTVHLYLATGREVSALALPDAARGPVTAPAPLPRIAGTGPMPGEVKALRVLERGPSPCLAVLSRHGTTRRLSLLGLQPTLGRRAEDGVPAERSAESESGSRDTTVLTWHARLRIGPSSCGGDGRPGDALWILADDPRDGCWSHRLTPGAPPVTPPAGHSRLRTSTAVSSDGTSLPVTVCDPPSPAGTGPAPVLVTVYGGFGVPLEPSWDPILAAWLTAGGRVAWVHARGGGEFGPEWAAAGRGAGKSRAVDDLCAAARALVDQGEADPGRLAGLAASNGGLVLAAAVLRAPRLFSAVACAAPLTDMARYTSGGGLGRLWHDEYGDPADPAALAALLAYSPYHHVRQGESYPATLLITGGNDARVPPWHAWKLCAALQEAGSGRQPVLLDHQPGTGHLGRNGAAATALSARVLALLATRTGLAAPTRPDPPSPATDANAPSPLRALRQPTAPAPSSRSIA